MMTKQATFVLNVQRKKKDDDNGSNYHTLKNMYFPNMFYDMSY